MGTAVKGGGLIIAGSENDEQDFFRKISEEWVPAKQRGDVGQQNSGTVTSETEDEVDEER